MSAFHPLRWFGTSAVRQVGPCPRRAYDLTPLGIPPAPCHPRRREAEIGEGLGVKSLLPEAAPAAVREIGQAGRDGCPAPGQSRRDFRQVLQGSGTRAGSPLRGVRDDKALALRALGAGGDRVAGGADIAPDACDGVAGRYRQRGGEEPEGDDLLHGTSPSWIEPWP